MEQEYAFYNDEETRRLSAAGDLVELTRHMHAMTGGEPKDRDTCRQCIVRARHYINLESKGLMIWDW